MVVKRGAANEFWLPGIINPLGGSQLTRQAALPPRSPTPPPPAARVLSWPGAFLWTWTSASLQEVTLPSGPGRSTDIYASVCLSRGLTLGPGWPQTCGDPSVSASSTRIANIQPRLPSGRWESCGCSHVGAGYAPQFCRAQGSPSPPCA